MIDYFDRTGPREPLRRILFVKLVEQGSSVLACSAIRRAVELVGRENVYFLVFEENRFILDAMGLIPLRTSSPSTPMGLFGRPWVGASGNPAYPGAWD